jgi:hypothetical protein
MPATSESAPLFTEHETEEGAVQVTVTIFGEAEAE